MSSMNARERERRELIRSINTLTASDRKKDTTIRELRAEVEILWPLNARLKERLNDALEALQARNIAAAQAQRQGLTDEDAFERVKGRILHEMRQDLNRKNGQHSILKGRGACPVEMANVWLDVKGWLGARSQTLVRLTTALMSELVPHPGVKQAFLDRKRMLMGAMCVACIYKGGHDHAQFGFGKLVSFFLKATTRSKRTLRLISYLIPCAFAPAAMANAIAKLAKSFSKSNVPDKTNIILGWDNVAKGDYKGARQARCYGGEHVISVVTNRFCAALRTPQGKKHPAYLQGSRQHSPALWRRLDTVPADVVQVKRVMIKNEQATEADLLQTSLKAALFRHKVEA